MKINVIYPSKPSEILLKDYVKYIELFKDDEEKIVTVEELFKIFVNVSPEKLPIEAVERIAETILKAIEGINECKALEPIITLEGKRFGFIPQLDKMTYGEYKDVVNYLQKYETFNKAFEVLYRPIVKEYKGLYDIEAYEGTGKHTEDFKNLTMDIVNGTLVFFYLLIIDLSKHIPNYLPNDLAVKKLLAAAV